MMKSPLSRRKIRISNNYGPFLSLEYANRIQEKEICWYKKKEKREWKDQGQGAGQDHVLSLQYSH